MSTKLAKAVARLERCLERWDPKDLLSVVPGDLRTVLDALKEAQARKLCPNRVDARLREKLSTSRTTCAYCEAALAAVRLAQDKMNAVPSGLLSEPIPTKLDEPDLTLGDLIREAIAALDQAFGSGA